MMMEVFFYFTHKTGLDLIRKGQVRPVSEGSFIDQFNSLNP
jgi:hypothetical protein